MGYNQGFINGLSVYIFGGTLFGDLALEFSRLLEVTEADAIYSHESCCRSDRSAPVALGFKGE